MTKGMCMDPKAHPPLKPVHHGVDAIPLIRLSSLVDEERPALSRRSITSLVSLDRRR
jgi:hypothetical protein